MKSISSNPVSEGLERELDPLWRFTLYLTKDKHDAEDLFQRTCLRALEQHDKYEATGQLRSWLFRISQNIWYNELRSRKIRKSKSFVQPDPLNDTDDEAHRTNNDRPDTNLLFDQVFSAVEGLPEAQRLVIILVCVEGFSYRDAAAVLDVPIGTVMSRLARARLALGSKFLESRSSGAKSSGTGAEISDKKSRIEKT